MQYFWRKLRFYILQLSGIRNQGLGIKEKGSGNRNQGKLPEFYFFNYTFEGNILNIKTLFIKYITLYEKYIKDLWNATTKVSKL